MASTLKSYNGDLALVSDTNAIEGYIKQVKIFNLDVTGIKLLDSAGNDVINLTMDSSMNVATQYNLKDMAGKAGIIQDAQMGRFQGDGSTTQFTPSKTFNPSLGLVFLNGVNVTEDVDISDGANIKFDTAPDSGDNIDYIFFDSIQFADTVTLSSDQDISGVKTFSKDVVISDENQGVVLVDRSDTSKKYRLYVDNGNLGIETV